MKSRWVVTLGVVPILVAAGIVLVALARHPDNENDRAASAALSAAATDVEQRLEREAEQLERLGAVIARDPKFFAMLTLPKADRQSADFRNALDGVLQDFQRDAETPIFAVTDERGSLLARAQRPAAGMTDLSGAPYIRAACGGKTGRGFLAEQGKAYRVVAVPVTTGRTLVGTLCVGTTLGSEWGRRLSRSLSSEVAIAIDGQITESTLPPSPLRKILAQRVAERSLRGVAPGDGADVVVAGGGRFVAIRREMAEPSVGGRLEYVLVHALRSEASPLDAMRWELLIALAIGLLLAIASGVVLAVVARRDARRVEAAHRAEVARLNEIDRMRSGLMAGASSEVLEPADAIRTCADLMSDGVLGDLAAPQKEGIVAIRRAAEVLTRLGHDLENLSLLERHELQLALERVDVGNLVEDVVVRVVPFASDRRQSVTFEVEPDLIHPAADSARLSKAILNLALNAVRFTPEGGTVEIGVRRIDRGVGIWVVDEGVASGNGDGSGVSPEASGRSGLGLTAAHGIIEAHGGSLRVWSEPGMGSTFTVDLPLPRAAVGAAGAVAPGGAASTPASSTPASPLAA